MTLKSLFAALSLALMLPVAVQAQGCDKDQVSMSCAAGTSWDDAAKKCVTVSS